MTVRYTFGKTSHLRRREDFDRVFGRRCSAADDRLIVYVDANGLDVSRIGLAVGRRVGNSVERHRVKRLIREAYRLSQHDLPGGLDIVCLPQQASEPSLDAYRESLVRLVTLAEAKLKRRDVVSADRRRRGG